MHGIGDCDDSSLLLEQVNQALQNATPLRIQGSNSKGFLGRVTAGEILDTRSHRGIVSYDPTELVITARCGTPLSELAHVLDAAQLREGLDGRDHHGALWVGCGQTRGPGHVPAVGSVSHPP